MATKPNKGKATESVSPASQPQTAAPSNLQRLKTLHESVTANWHIQMGIEANAEAVLTKLNGGVTLDNPHREVWENWFTQARDHRRVLKGLLDEIDSAIWLTQRCEAATTDTLQEWYANARLTGGTCGGHKKGYRNERLAAAYRAELESRKVKPDGREGIFNGDGAS